MTIKEQSLIKAVSNVGALPGFLTANEAVSGVVAATACGFFGGLVMLFQASVVGGGAETLFGPVRAGALAGHGFALLAMGIGWGWYASDPPRRTEGGATVWAGRRPCCGCWRGRRSGARCMSGSRGWGRWSGLEA